MRPASYLARLGVWILVVIGIVAIARAVDSPALVLAGSAGLAFGGAFLGSELDDRMNRRR